jgi:cellulose synthase/poly-beta-1,6-N-acetylglucosamine synthase-like glycosyltransferase
MAETTFWVALCLVVYTYVGYGAAVWLLAHLRPRSAALREDLPSVTVVVTAFNEEDRIGARLRNLLAVDYPPELLEIVVASDGSTDGTAVRARQFEPRVRVEAFAVRRGKPAMLNDVIPSAWGEVVVMADARQRFDRRALRALVAGFADPKVGAVSGELILLDAGESEAAVEGAALYWDYEKTIRRAESRVDSTVGVTGAIYAIRRALFEPLPDATILDDVVVPMRIARRGFRVLFEPQALAFDQRVATGQQEFSRKVRTLAGNFQMFSAEPWLLSPRQNRLWWQTVSHKGLRLLLPAFYGIAFVSNAMLLDVALYRWTMAAQCGFLGAAAVGAFLPVVRRVTPLAALPYTICFLSWATVVGFVRFARGQQSVTWERVPATPSGDGATGSS